MIEKVAQLGNDRVESQRGWGVREIQQINKTDPNCQNWVIIETYYKYDEYKLNIIDSEQKMRKYLLVKLDTYKNDCDEDEKDESYGADVDNDDKDNKTIEQLIEKIVKMGNDRVDSEYDWGVREIKKI